MPEDALDTKPTQHDYTGLMRLEAPHEVKPNPDYEPGRPEIPRGIVEDQRERLSTNDGEPPVDGVAGVAPGGDGEVLTTMPVGDGDTTPAQVFDTNGELVAPDADGVTTLRDEAFDPGAHTVEEVLAYLEGDGSEAHPAVTDAERSRVLDAERAGKARKGILGDS